MSGTSLQNKALLASTLITVEGVAFSWPQSQFFTAMRAICIVRPGIVQQFSLVFEGTPLPVFSRVPLRVSDLVKTQVTRNGAFKPGAICLWFHIIIILTDSITEDDHSNDDDEDYKNNRPHRQTISTTSTTTIVASTTSST